MVVLINVLLLSMVGVLVEDGDCNLIVVGRSAILVITLQKVVVVSYCRVMLD